MPVANGHNMIQCKLMHICSSVTDVANVFTQLESVQSCSGECGHCLQECLSPWIQKGGGRLLACGGGIVTGHVRTNWAVVETFTPTWI